jgi:hypothetical protein
MRAVAADLARLNLPDDAPVPTRVADAFLHNFNGWIAGLPSAIAFELARTMQTQPPSADGEFTCTPQRMTVSQLRATLALRPGEAPTPKPSKRKRTCVAEQLDGHVVETMRELRPLEDALVRISRLIVADVCEEKGDVRQWTTAEFRNMDHDTRESLRVTHPATYEALCAEVVNDMRGRKLCVELLGWNRVEIEAFACASKLAASSLCAKIANELVRAHGVSCVDCLDAGHFTLAQRRLIVAAFANDCVDVSICAAANKH